MATIITKNSQTASAVPSAASLAVGELAVNTADGKLYTEHTGGVVKQVGGNVQTISAGSGISVTNPSSTNPTVTNTGVTSVAAGTGISVSAGTGASTITNTGVTAITAGSNISISGGTGNVTINATAGAPSTAQVLSAYAGATSGAVGTYVYCTVNSNTNFNSNVSGSSLRGYSNGSESYATLALSGTWKCMGSTYINDGTSLPIAISNNQSFGSLWLRIS